MQNDFLSGIIEGFYGAPWTPDERRMVLDWMRDWGLNTYFYGPKDDLKQRLLWRDLYSEEECRTLKELIDDCAERKIQFIYALSPGLDIEFSNPDELTCLKDKVQQLADLGCQNFALLFDDIPDRMSAADRERWDSFAAAQSFVSNEIFHWVQKRFPRGRFLFCPTPYCGRMRSRELGGADYLETLGRELHPGIDVFWTGPEIISKTISSEHIEELTQALRRPPLIWDNLHANDYDGQRVYCGPYSGRSIEVRDHVRGILINPNNEAPLNFIAARTLALFVHCESAEWDPRSAYLQAMQEWHGEFQSAGKPISLEALTQLGDCYYLPFELGPEAIRLYELAQEALSKDSQKDKPQALGDFKRLATQLRDTCSEIVNLKNRNLFTALSRRTWDLREEMELLLTCVRSLESNPSAPLKSDFHLPGTYRGGMVSNLRGLLIQKPDETFVPNTQKP